MTTSQAALSSRRRLLTGLPGFAAASTVLVVVSALLLSLAFRGPGDARAVMASAIFAVAIQLAAFRTTRRLVAQSLMIGIGAGALVRFGGLFAYALTAGAVLGLPLPAALISLMVFYFLSMLVEPLFLRS